MEERREKFQAERDEANRKARVEEAKRHDKHMQQMQMNFMEFQGDLMKRLFGN